MAERRRLDAVYSADPQLSVQIVSFWQVFNLVRGVDPRNDTKSQGSFQTVMDFAPAVGGTIGRLGWSAVCASKALPLNLLSFVKYKRRLCVPMVATYQQESYFIGPWQNPAQISALVQ
jgi:hypothetical protein